MNGTELAAIITASVGGLGSLGAAAKFLWDKIEKRFADIESDLEKCRERELETKEHRAVHLTVIELMWVELRRFDPESQVLERVKKLLDDLKKRNTAGQD